MNVRKARLLHLGVAALCLMTPLRVFADDGGGGNSGASAETRGEVLRPSIAATFLSQLPTRPRSTGLKVVVNHCPSSVETQARTYFARQIDAQISCLKQAELGWGPRAATTLKRIMDHIPTVTIHCRASNDQATDRKTPMVEFLAHASQFGEPSFPVIDLNWGHPELQELARTNRLQPLFLHEALHWTGTQHFNGPDVAYLGAMCCGEGRFDPSLPSCALLDTAPEEWDTAQTQQRFSQLLEAQNTKTVIRLYSAWFSWIRLMTSGRRRELAEADLMLDLLRQIAPEYRYFWDGLASAVPSLPHSQHVTGMWARAVVLGDQSWANYRTLHLNCFELALTLKKDFKEMLEPIARMATDADREFLSHLNESCTKQSQFILQRGAE